MINISKNKYYHCYATANDNRYYFRDIQNLWRIRKTYSGVEKVIMYIAISEVNKTNWIDRIFVRVIKTFFFLHPSIKLKKIFFKTNIGRDFSSYSKMNDLIQKDASTNDYVFFQNRSGYGPFRKGWLREMTIQFNKHDLTALCGSTINFNDHPNRSQRNDVPHIQTYAFLTKILFLKMLGNSFPGKDEIIRLNIILKGEIGLSQFFFNKGFGITCMEWPEKFITNNSAPVNEIDIKENVTKQHQFYHKVYFNKPKRLY